MKKNYSSRKARLIFIALCLLMGIKNTQAQLSYYIGTGTQTNCETCIPSPWYDWYSGDRTQQLYLASELTGAGM